ncbi:hypothetical protein HAX54_034450, partial [Datura stramonium]|nr:hypothetical protein [Datura stramonium]
WHAAGTQRCTPWSLEPHCRGTLPTLARAVLGGTLLPWHVPTCGWAVWTSSCRRLACLFRLQDSTSPTHGLAPQKSSKPTQQRLIMLHITRETGIGNAHDIGGRMNPSGHQIKPPPSFHSEVSALNARSSDALVSQGPLSSTTRVSTSHCPFPSTSRTFSSTSEGFGRPKASFARRGQGDLHTDMSNCSSSSKPPLGG